MLKHTGESQDKITTCKEGDVKNVFYLFDVMFHDLNILITFDKKALAFWRGAHSLLKAQF